MRVLFFLPTIQPGGVATALQNIANYLSERHVEVVVAGDGAREHLSLNSRIQVLEKRGRSKAAFVQFLLRSKDTTYIGVQAHNAYWLLIFSLFRGGRDVVSWEHSSPVTSVRSEYPKSSWLHLFLKVVSTRLARNVICVSKGAVEELNSLPCVPKARVLYVPNIIYDRGRLQSSARPKHVGRYRFLSVGRLSIEKDIGLALTALRELQDVDWTYLIVGDGPLRESLMRRCNDDEALRNRVEFETWKKDASRYFREATALLLPSRYEGMPTVLVEATVWNLPVIAADCQTGPREIVRNGENGFLFKVGDAQSMTRALRLFVDAFSSIRNGPEHAADFESSYAGNRFFSTVLSPST